MSACFISENFAFNSPEHQYNTNVSIHRSTNKTPTLGPNSAGTRFRAPTHLHKLSGNSERSMQGWQERYLSREDCNLIESLGKIPWQEKFNHLWDKVIGLIDNAWLPPGCYSLRSQIFYIFLLVTKGAALSYTNLEPPTSAIPDLTAVPIYSLLVPLVSTTGTAGRMEIYPARRTSTGTACTASAVGNHVEFIQPQLDTTIRWPPLATTSQIWALIQPHQEATPF